MNFPKVLSLFAVVFIVAVGPVPATEPTTGKRRT